MFLVAVIVYAGVGVDCVPVVREFTIAVTSVWPDPTSSTVRRGRIAHFFELRQRVVATYKSPRVHKKKVLIRSTSLFINET